MLAVQNEREWERLCREVLRRPELVDDPRFATNEARSANRAALDAIMAAALQPYSAAEVADLLEGAGIAHSRINDVAGLLEHPQLSERQRWIEVPTPAGPIRCIAPPIIMDGTPTGVPAGAIPAVGEHSAAILAELGYSANEITALRASGVIAAP